MTVRRVLSLLLSGYGVVMFSSCDVSQNDILAPYGGGVRPLSALSIQDSVFVPRITWVGGYVSAFGINRGTRAALDSTLVWLIKMEGNNLRYPVVVGQVPPGAVDVTSSYGGTVVSRLTEDTEYTFWIMKHEAWSRVASHANKVLAVDSAATSPVRVQGDTLFLERLSFTYLRRRIDIFVNVKNLEPWGRLGRLSVEATDSSNNPVVRFTITQTSDTAVAAFGLVVGTSVYNVNNVVWEVLSEDLTGPQPVYRSKNVVPSPIIMGKTYAGTKTFTHLPSTGLERNRQYYFWIATKDWNGVSRTRTASYYAWITFNTW